MEIKQIFNFRYGPVSTGLVIGVASHVIWPPSHRSTLSRHSNYHYLHRDTTVTKHEELQDSSRGEGVTYNEEKSLMFRLKVLKNFIIH